MAGMNVEEKEDMCRIILDVNEQFGTTIALIEHDMGVVMDLSDRVVVLEYGRKIADGTPDEVRADQRGDRCLSRRAKGVTGMGFFFEVVIGGLLAGVLYSLVALGFVLIFKASGVFNFAQGAMVLFAALTLVRLTEYLPFWAAFAVSCAVMIGVAFVIERVVLRRLVNQEGIILFMATLGIAFFLEGFGQAIWGSDIYTLDLGIPKDPSFILGFDLRWRIAGGQAGCLRRRGGGRAGGGSRVVFPEDQGRARVARGGR